MLKNKLSTFFLLLLLPFFVNAQTSKYSNGVVKEVGYTEGQLVTGERKLYDKRGKLIEQHFFNNGNKGVIKSYFNDTTIASVVPVVQSLQDGKYTLTIEADSEILGFFKGTATKKYNIIVKNEFDLDYKLSYKRYNSLFNDFVLLYKRRFLEGIQGSKLTYYTRNGTIQATSTIGNADEGNSFKSLYDTKQVKAEGNLKRVRSSDFYIGLWLFYYKNGVIEKEETFYNGETAMTHIKYGTRIDTAIYRYKSGKTKAKVLFPQPADANHRTDTLETFYDNGKKDEDGQLRSKYDEDKKVLVHKAGIGRDDIFEFSGLYEEYYENGERKTRGYLCKYPRRMLSQLEIMQDGSGNLQCVLKPTKNTILFQNDKSIKQIGMWYYFDQEGNIIEIKEYRLCGQLSENVKFTQKKVDKESSKYKMRKNTYEFQDILYDNE